jgi:hypothetical protein
VFFVIGNSYFRTALPFCQQGLLLMLNFYGRKMASIISIAIHRTGFDNDVEGWLAVDEDEADENDLIVRVFNSVGVTG